VKAQITHKITHTLPNKGKHRKFSQIQEKIGTYSNYRKKQEIMGMLGGLTTRSTQ
jgi:hypothetical protein